MRPKSIILDRQTGGLRSATHEVLPLNKTMRKRAGDWDITDITDTVTKAGGTKGKDF